MELKKSYKGFLIWMICFCLCCFGFIFVKIDSTALLLRMIMNVMTFSIAILTFMIYRNGYVYWYTGITYEDAAKAGEERRKAYAFKHWKIFGLFAVIYFFLSVMLHLLQVSHWVDVIFVTLGIIAVAIRTMWYKL